VNGLNLKQILIEPMEPILHRIGGTYVGL